MEKHKNCPFCLPIEDKEQQIAFENEFCMYLQHNAHQKVIEGSGVIVPKRHRETVFDLTREEWNGIYELLEQVKLYVDAKYHPNGYTLGWNVGEASNQSIPHAHLHILPRFNDEPYAGKGLRHWLKSDDNRRPGR